MSIDQSGRSTRSVFQRVTGGLFSCASRSPQAKGSRSELGEGLDSISYVSQPIPSVVALRAAKSDEELITTAINEVRQNTTDTDELIDICSAICEKSAQRLGLAQVYHKVYTLKQVKAEKKWGKKDSDELGSHPRFQDFQEKLLTALGHST